jgi:hypothetical protein
MASCGVCSAHDHKLDVRPCVACGRPACSKCRGDEGDGYWTHGGKKGYACIDCISKSQAYEGGPFAVGREIKSFAHAVLMPDILAAVDVRLERIRDEIVPPIVDGALARVEDLTRATLKEAESTTERVVGRLETAIRNQRVNVVTDADGLLKAVQATLRTTLIWVAVVVGLVNAAGIVVAVLVGQALGR